MPPDDDATALDIVLACRRVRRFLEDVDEPSFQADEEKRWAVVSQLLIIGEAARRLSHAFQREHPRIPWRQITAMRNRLIHQYDKINWQLVWRTAIQDVPILMDEMEEVVPADEPQDDGSAAIDER